MVIISDSTEVWPDNEVFLLEEAPQELIVWQKASLLGLLPIVRPQESYEVVAPRRGALVSVWMICGDVLVVIVLALAGK